MICDKYRGKNTSPQCVNTVLIRWISRQSVGTSEQHNALCDVTEHWTVKYFHGVSGLFVVCEVRAVGDETVFINECVHCQLWAEAKATVEH
jgi:hypothetical protein